MTVLVNTVETYEGLEETVVEAAVMEAGDVAGKKAVESEASHLEAVREISDYEKARDERVAEMRAEFRLRFPTFEEDLLELRVAKVKKTRKVKTNQVAARKSVRINDKAEIPEERVVGKEPHHGPDPRVVIESGENEPRARFLEKEEETCVVEEDQETADEVVHAGDHETGDKSGLVGGEDHEEDDEAAHAEEHEADDEAAHAGDHEAGDKAGLVEGGDHEAGDEAAFAEDQVTGVIDVCAEGEDHETGDKAALGKFACISCQRTFRLVENFKIDSMLDFKNIYFRDPRNLKRHVKLIHCVRRKAQKCPRPWCDLEFSIVAELVEHKAGCLKVCPTCSKSFTRRDKFAGHMRAHRTMSFRMID